jgi:hypothetical protein
MDANTSTTDEAELGETPAGQGETPIGQGGTPAGSGGVPVGAGVLPQAGETSVGLEGLAEQPGEAPAGPGGPLPQPGGLPAGLEGLAAAISELASQDPAEQTDVRLAEQVLSLHRLVDQLDGACLRLLATVDARGAAGAEAGVQAASTAGWLRATLRMGPGTASRRVRTARALHRGPLAATATALAAGEVSVEHAEVLADGTHDLAPAQVAQAEGVLVDAARRLDPGRLRRLTAHLRTVIDPDGTELRGRVHLERRGLWLSAGHDGMVAVDGLLDPEAGETVRAALLPLAKAAGPDDARNAAQRRADGLADLARQALQAGRLPHAGGVRPQLTVTVELASLLAGHGVGGTGGWGGLLPAEAVRRVACDATVTRAIVHRHTGHPAAGHPYPGAGGSGADGGHGERDGGLAARLRQAVALLPAPLGAPTELLDLGRATRLISPALRRALAVRDGGCVAQGCDRPAPWTDAHHLTHWLEGGVTSLENLVLLCRVHHRAVHEGGWRLDRGGGRHALRPPTHHLAPAP